MADKARATKVVEVYQEGTLSLEVERTILVMVPADWTNDQIEERLNDYGTGVGWSEIDEDDADVTITEIKEVQDRDAVAYDDLDEDWSAA